MTCLIILLFFGTIYSMISEGFSSSRLYSAWWLNAPPISLNMPCLGDETHRILPALLSLVH